MAIVEYLNYEVLDDYGWGIYDEDLFEKAADEDLSEEDYGELDVPGGEYILDAAEAARHDWPFACRNGLCSNCAVILRDGEIEMDGNQVLTEEEVNEKLVRLTCIGRPTSDSLQVIYNAKELDYLRNRLM